MVIVAHALRFKRFPPDDFPTNQFDGTTIMCVRRGDTVAPGGYGQVPLGNAWIKDNARKLRRFFDGKI